MAELITSFFFERPLYLIPVVLVAQFVLIRIWARRRTQRARRAVWAGFVIVPLLVLVQALVRTDRERIITICEEMAVAAEAGDVGGIGSHVSESFQAQDINKAGFLDALGRALTRIHVEETRLSAFEVTFTDHDHARVRFRAVARVIAAGEVAYRRPSTWDLRFEKRSGTWKLIELNPVSTPGFPFGALRELLDAVGAR